MPDSNGHDDFIVARTAPALSNGLPIESTFVPAYHWACAIDDHDGAYPLLVRASDLATSARLQRAIHEWVSSSEGASTPVPAVFHTSLVTRDDGGRLEKRTAGVTWPELSASGWTKEKILAAFEKSFDCTLLKKEKPASGGLFFEKDREISVSRLLG